MTAPLKPRKPRWQQETCTIDHQSTSRRIQGDRLNRSHAHISPLRARLPRRCEQATTFVWVVHLVFGVSGGVGVSVWAHCAPLSLGGVGECVRGGGLGSVWESGFRGWLGGWLGDGSVVVSRGVGGRFALLWRVYPWGVRVYRSTGLCGGCGGLRWGWLRGVCLRRFGLVAVGVCLTTERPNDLMGWLPVSAGVLGVLRGATDYD